MTERKDAIVKLINEHGLFYSKNTELSSGIVTDWYIDAKRALSNSIDLQLVTEAFNDLVNDYDIEYNAVGGMILGAVSLTFALCFQLSTEWFLVRKEPKDHGTKSMIEGADINGMNVILVDDVVTTGASLKAAFQHIEDAGGNVVLATCLVDRGDNIKSFFSNFAIPYKPLLTYNDLGIEPIDVG